MRIGLLGHDCPVLPGVVVGVHHGGDVVYQHPANAIEACWLLEGRLVEGSEPARALRAFRRGPVQPFGLRASVLPRSVSNTHRRA